MTLHEFLQTFKSNKDFLNIYLRPLLASVWSSDPAMIMDLPIGHLLAFFENFGALEGEKAEEWRVIRGGAFRYISKLIAPYQSKIRIKTPVESVRRFPDHVLVKARGAAPERFDEIVIATPH